MPAHAKPLSRRQARRRRTITKYTVGASSCLLAATLAWTAMAMPGTPTDNTVPSRTTVTISADTTGAASRSTHRDLLAEYEAINVNSDGKWVFGKTAEIDASKLTSEKPKPADEKELDAEATKNLQSDAQTIAIVNDTKIENEGTVNHATGDTGNAYPWGQCTWWAYVRRHQLGLPVGSYFGNGHAWAHSAAMLGYPVDNKPQTGDIIVFQPGQAGASAAYGHVAIVEQVHDNDSITISESNAQGLGVISSRVIANAGQYTYIH